MSANLLLFLSTVLWGFWGFANKNAVAYAHPFTVQWMYAIPNVVLIPVFIYFGNRMSPNAGFDRIAMFWSLAAGLASIAATVLLFFVLENKPASLVVAATSAYPLITLALAILAGSEKLDLQRLVGIFVIIAGVILVQTSK
jgi:drug/metabolite transporter (DMT)-like permease